MPELRAGPPWAMEEMILAEPGLVAPILASPEAVEAAEWIRETEAVVVTGCGTSEHAAMAGAALLGARVARRLRGEPGPAGRRRADRRQPRGRHGRDARGDEARPRRAHDPDHGQARRRTGADLTIATPLVDT